jgi:hypothetical protein
MLRVIGVGGIQYEGRLHRAVSDGDRSLQATQDPAPQQRSYLLFSLPGLNFFSSRKFLYVILIGVMNPYAVEFVTFRAGRNGNKLLRSTFFTLKNVLFSSVVDLDSLNSEPDTDPYPEFQVNLDPETDLGF